MLCNTKRNRNLTESSSVSTQSFCYLKLKLHFLAKIIVAQISYKVTSNFVLYTVKTVSLSAVFMLYMFCH